jgi:uncharacterized sulfatase
MMPHTPHDPPERLLAKYRDKTPSLHVAKYWAMVEWFDETCGQLLGHLDKEQLADNTVVVYVADNGWVQAEDKADSVRSKRTPYDAGLRTPILVRWPGKAKSGVGDDPVTSVDIAPTVLAACGVKAPAGLPGVDLLDAKARAARGGVVGACFTHNAVDLNDPAKNVLHRWTVRGHTKLIVPHGKGDPELYDLAADPFEKADLATKRPDEVRRLRKELDGWWNPGG